MDRELVLEDNRATKLRLTLLPDAIRVEELWGPVEQRCEMRYRELIRQPYKPLRTTIIWLVVSTALPLLCLAMAYLAGAESDRSYLFGALFFAIPALLGLLELLRSFRQELCFTRQGEDYAPIRFTRRELEHANVCGFVQELTDRISAAAARSTAR